MGALSFYVSESGFAGFRDAQDGRDAPLMCQNQDSQDSGMHRMAGMLRCHPGNPEIL
jgi:hypothetical protein